VGGREERGREGGKERGRERERERQTERETERERKREREAKELVQDYTASKSQNWDFDLKQCGTKSRTFSHTTYALSILCLMYGHI
jgi:hypothetical protein